MVLQSGEFLSEIIEIARQECRLRLLMIASSNVGPMFPCLFEISELISARHSAGKIILPVLIQDALIDSFRQVIATPHPGLEGIFDFG
jgi:hypothetical protein